MIQLVVVLMLTRIGILTLEHFDSSLNIPQYMTPGAAGADICASFPVELREKGMTLGPWERAAIATGLVFEIEPGWEVQVRPRSGLSLKTGLSVINAPGTIDCDYRGEIKVLIANLSPNAEVITHGMRIAQLVVAPAVQANFQLVSSVSKTIRGEQGFGSTGISQN